MQHDIASIVEEGGAIRNARRTNVEDVLDVITWDFRLLQSSA